MPSLSKEEAVNLAKNAIMNLALANVRKASAGGAKMGAFILAACVIDYLSCLYSGSDSNAESYKQFVREFFDDKRYDPHDLWENIRCKLVHNYTVKDGRFGYTDNEPHLHFRTDKHGRTYLNLEDFVETVESAAKKYFDLVDKDPAVRATLVKRIRRVGIMKVFDPEF